METLTLKVDVRTKAELEREAADQGVNRSAYVRELIEARHDADDLRDQVREQETTINRLDNQLKAANTRIDDANDAIAYVDDERRYRRASVLTRFKWWVTGVPGDGEGGPEG
jgi:septal ring factor EnvC (AmiA/AmiB activator)